MLVQILLWMLWKWDKSLPKLETSISVHEDSVNKHSVSEFLSPKLLHMIQKLDEQLNLFYPFFHTDPMPTRNLWTMRLSKNTAWILTKGSIT